MQIYKLASRINDVNFFLMSNVPKSHYKMHIAGLMFVVGNKINVGNVLLYFRCYQHELRYCIQCLRIHTEVLLSLDVCLHL